MDERPSVRWSAEALGALKHPDALNPLIQALKDKDPSIRWRAAEALGALKLPDALNPLIQALSDERPSVRWSAAEAIEQIDMGSFL